MSCPQCPHCQSGVEKGGLAFSGSSLPIEEEISKEKETPKFPVRGKAREYSEAFELVWKAYARREQKLEAFGVWLIRAKEVGGEPQLATLCLGALKWQRPAWARTWEKEGKNVAPYLERYLKRRKWEDEPLPTFAPQVPQAARVGGNAVVAADRKVAELRAAQSRPAPSLEQLAALRGAK